MSNRPILTIRDGLIKASIWKNEHSKTTGQGTTIKTIYNVDIVRSYKDREGNWKDTTSFSGNELLKVANLSREAYNRILILREGDKNAEPEADNLAHEYQNHATGGYQ